MATNDLRNWLKLNTLIDRACVVLRQLFQKLWKTRFGHEWSGTQDDISIVLPKRQKKNIGKLQKDTILSGDLNSWDLTTLRTMLTSRDFLNQTAKEETNVNYLATLRNKLAHSASKGITDDVFNADWRKASSILAEFGESEADLELLKQDSQIGGVKFMKKEEYINDESTSEARRLKEAGNALFQQENWAESIKLYTKSILLPGIPSADRATLHSNRSISFLKQNELSLALEDAKKTIELWPEWWRGHYRLGQVYTEMNKYKKAEDCFDEAFAREPLRDEIKEAKSYARLKAGQMDRNDAIDPHLANRTFDDDISDFESRIGTQANADMLKQMLHTKINDDFMRNWQDCQKGKYCQMGGNGYPRDYKLATKYYKKAADRGSAEGLYALGRMTMEGKGVKRDMHLGISMLREAAAKPPQLHGHENDGVAQAEHALGLCYEYGIGVRKDELAAMDWYEKGSEHGALPSANNLGLIYRRKGDFVKAEQYFKIAANGGDAKGMLNLAAFYCCSQFDPELCLTWCQRARNAGETCPELDYMEKSSKDCIHTMNKSGFKEKESKNTKARTGLHTQGRVECDAQHIDLFASTYTKLLDELEEQLKKNKDDKYIKSTRFPPDQLEKHATSSAYARELQKALNHSKAAWLTVTQLGNSNPLSLPLCEKFITELSSCAKIDYMVAEIPGRLHEQICSLVDRILTLKTTFHEDTCICYAELNGLSSLESTVTFLSECIRKYPRNVHFTQTRGQLYSFLERYEDGIRDMNASIKLDPSRYHNLYCRASMMRLFYPKVSAKATIAAYKEFLAAAPEDHRHVPDSYYGIARMNYNLAEESVKPNFENMDLSATKHYFQLGVEAESKQLPFFLPYKSDTKSHVQHWIKLIEIVYKMCDGNPNASKQESRVAKKSKAHVANPAVAYLMEHSADVSEQSEAHEGGKCTAARMERVFRSNLSDPSREYLIKKQRRNIAHSLEIIYPAANAAPGTVQLSIFSSWVPAKFQKSASSLAGLKAITLHEMDHRQDKIYDGYVLTATIIDDILFMTSMQVIIEDSAGDVLLCTIYNWSHMEDRVKARKVFGIGCKMLIINPYMRMAMDGKSVIRVDDPASIVFDGFVEKMCRYCCEPNSSKTCAKCNASYCDKQCQMLDWKRDHKLICVRNP